MGSRIGVPLETAAGEKPEAVWRNEARGRRERRPGKAKLEERQKR